MQTMADSARWESALAGIGRGDLAAVRAAVRFARTALSTPKGVVSYASTLTFGMPGQAAHGWYLRIDDTDRFAAELVKALRLSRKPAAWRALAAAGLDMALAQASAVQASAQIPDESAARLHFPVTPPTVRHRTIQTAVATTLEAIVSTDGGGDPGRSLRTAASGLVREIRDASRPGAGPATPEVLVVRWRKLGSRLARLRAELGGN